MGAMEVDMAFRRRGGRRSFHHTSRRRRRGSSRSMRGRRGVAGLRVGYRL